MGHTEQGKFPCIKLREFRQHEFHATSLESIVHLFEADDCHGGAGDHDEDAEDEEEVEDLVAEGAVREAPVRHLRKNVVVMKCAQFFPLLKKRLTRNFL